MICWRLAMVSRDLTYLAIPGYRFPHLHVKLDSTNLEEVDADQDIMPSTSPSNEKKRTSNGQRVANYFSSSIRLDSMVELELLLLTICTGIQDAISFPDYHCFASNQTGNTVLLALASTVPRLTDELIITKNVGVSLACFLAGGYITGQISHRYVNARSRLWLLLCNTIQTILVFGAAAIQFSHPIVKDDNWALGTLACLAFSSGSQVNLSRTFKIPEISTAMATAAWMDLMVDANIFKLRNKSRDRRLSFIVALVIGSYIGAAIYRTAGSAWAVCVSGFGKLLVLSLFFFNSHEQEKQGNEELGR